MSHAAHRDLKSLSIVSWSGTCFAIIQECGEWMQINKKDSLPASLQNWDSLPLWMRSLQPYDKMCCCCCASPGGSKADDATAAAAKDPEAAVESA